MIKVTLVIGVILAIILSGCSTPGGTPGSSGKSSAPTAATPATPPRPEPDWINNESGQYGRIEYITKKAEANNAEQARQEARDKIVALFTYVDPSNGNTTKTSSATLIATAAPEIVSSVTIVDEWQNPDTKTFHALAAMQRKHGESYMKTRIPQLDQETQKAIDTAAIKNIDPLRRTGFLAKALRAQKQRQYLQQSMRTVDVTGRGIKPVWDVVRIEADLEEQLKQLKIQPAGVSDDKAERQAMVNLLTGGLKTAGLTPADSNRADYLLKGKLTIAPKRLPNNWVSGQGVLHIELAEKIAGLGRGEKRWEIEMPGLDEETAARRVTEKAEFTLKKEMRNVLLEIAINQP